MLRLLLFFARMGLIALLIGAAIVIYLLFYYSRGLPDYSQLVNYHPPSVTRIYASDGKLVEEYAYEHRVFIPISNIPKSLIEAFIAAEDKNFYKHPGVDLTSIFRAIVANINYIFHKQRKIEGGSTITQQVVKNFLLTPERSLGRKIKEAILSYMLSQTFSKEQILELYLNQMYLGKGYGVAVAAQNYFNKSIDELTLAESAFLAALPKAPSNYNPRTNYDKSKERRDYVITRMLDEGYINLESAKEAIATPISLRSRDASETVTADYYAETVRDEVIKMFGKDAFYTSGFTIITCLDSNLQKHAENSLAYGLRQYDQTTGYKGHLGNISIINWEENLKKFVPPEGLREYKIAVVLESTDNQSKIGLLDCSTSKIPFNEMKWAGRGAASAKNILKKGDVIIVEAIKDGYGLRQIPKVNGAILVMEAGTGKVLAAQGGYDFKASRFNRTTQAMRQPGSLSKTFVYLGALENGIPPDKIFDDAPITIYPGKGQEPWSPKNYGGNYYGPITMRQGLEKSRNLVTVRVAKAIGLNKVIDVIKRFGINKEPAKRFSIILGAIETTLEKMTTAYNIIASGGKKVDAHFIELIKDRNGKIIYQRDQRQCLNCQVNNDNIEQAALPEIIVEPTKMITDEATNYQITSMLTGAIERGTGAKAKKLGIVLAGKTGTTNESKDTWFVGFTPKIVVGTYVGYDTPKSLGAKATGGGIALPIFINFMEKAFPKLASLPFKVPESITLQSNGRFNEAYKNYEDEYEEEGSASDEEDLNIPERNYHRQEYNSSSNPNKTNKPYKDEKGVYKSTPHNSDEIY